jgi:hypothetical protein
MVSTGCMTAQKCNFPKSVLRMMMPESPIDFPEDRTDRLESIIVAGRETSNAAILRTRRETQEVLLSVSRMPAFC